MGKDIYIVYEYLGNDERITRKKGYMFITVSKDSVLTASDIIDLMHDIKAKLVTDFKIEDPNDIYIYDDIVITYIKEL